jgi:capsular polysaccharide biosynthesis protein
MIFEAKPLRTSEIPVTISSPDGCRLRTFHNIKYHSSQAVPDEIAKPERDFQVYEGFPLEIIEANDAFLPFGSKCLYDRQGVRINESCVRRCKGLAKLISAGSETISPPTDFITVDEPVVYLSWLQNHWGHFLTEGISRLWALSQYPELKQMLGAYCCYHLPHQNIRDFIEALDFNIYIGGDRRNQAIRFRKVFIPFPSFANQAKAYSVHRNAALKVVESYLQEDRPEVSNQPVFMSRSKVSSARTIRNQTELERALTRMGFLIVHPEELSLSSQINLFSHYRYFTGCWGSAFHSAILSRCPETIATHVLLDDTPNFDYLMFDSILGNEANYVRALTPVPGEAQVWPNLNLAIDVDKAVTYFERLV